VTNRAAVLFLLAGCASAGRAPASEHVAFVLVDNQTIEMLAVRADGVRVGTVAPHRTSCIRVPGTSFRLTYTAPAGAVQSRTTVQVNTDRDGRAWYWRVSGIAADEHTITPAQRICQ
jgi:hypothetical protein